MRQMGLMLGAAMVMSLAAVSFADSTTATASGGDRRQGKGFTFVGPTGWKFSKPSNPRAAGMFTSPDRKDGIAKATILIDTTSAGKHDVKTMAEIYAKNTGGKVVGGEIKVDGVAARRIVVEKRGRDLPEIAEMVMVVKDSSLYIIQGSAVDGKDISAQVEEIRASWKWE